MSFYHPLVKLGLESESSGPKEPKRKLHLCLSSAQLIAHSSRAGTFKILDLDIIDKLIWTLLRCRCRIRLGSALSTLAYSK